MGYNVTGLTGALDVLQQRMATQDAEIKTLRDRMVSVQRRINLLAATVSALIVINFLLMIAVGWL